MGRDSSPRARLRATGFVGPGRPQIRMAVRTRAITSAGSMPLKHSSWVGHVRRKHGLQCTLCCMTWTRSPRGCGPLGRGRSEQHDHRHAERGRHVRCPAVVGENHARAFGQRRRILPDWFGRRGSRHRPARPRCARTWHDPRHYPTARRGPRAPVLRTRVGTAPTATTWPARRQHPAPSARTLRARRGHPRANGRRPFDPRRKHANAHAVRERPRARVHPKRGRVRRNCA